MNKEALAALIQRFVPDCAGKPCSLTLTVLEDEHPLGHTYVSWRHSEGVVVESGMIAVDTEHDFRAAQQQFNELVARAHARLPEQRMHAKRNAGIEQHRAVRTWQDDWGYHLLTPRGQKMDWTGEDWVAV